MLPLAVYAVGLLSCVVGEGPGSPAAGREHGPRIASPVRLAPADDPPEKGAGGPIRRKLPAPFAAVAPGGDGRFLVLHLPKVKQVAVFDAKEGKVVKYVAVAEKSLVAAGRDHFFVIDTAAATLQRWSFAAFEKEATVRLPDDGPFDLALMGPGATGPLLLCPKANQFNQGGKPLLIDPITLREVPIKEGQFQGCMAATVRVSPDGQTFVWQPAFGFPNATVVAVADGKATMKLVNPANGEFPSGPPAPGPGGRYFYTPDGVFNDQLRRVHPGAAKPRDAGGVYVPAVHDSLFLRLTPPGGGPRFPNDPTPPAVTAGKVEVFFQGQFAPFATVDGVKAAPPAYLVPRYRALVVPGPSLDEIVVHPFDVDALLAASGVDYLLVTSDPPADAAAGTKFAYKPEVKSKKGGVKVKMDAGPDGMKVAADGTVTWGVPAGLVRQEVEVILTVSDESGQEVFHTFRINVVEPPAEKPKP